MLCGARADVTDFSYMTLMDKSAVKHNMLKEYGGSSPINGIFLYVAQPVERVLAVAFGKKYGGSRPINSIFVYMAQAFERVLAVAFGKKNYVGSSPTTGIFLYVAWQLNTSQQ